MKGFQLKINVKDSSTPMWRRVIIPEKLTFDRLHHVIQKLFAFENNHWYDFKIRKQKVWIPCNDFELESIFNNYETVSCFEYLSDYLEAGMTFDYHYDYDARWHFKIKVEKIIEDGKRYPVVLKYRGYNLIEDCGGIVSYEELILADFAFEQISFDLEEINHQLMEIEVEELLNESLYRDDFKQALDTIKNCLDQQQIVNFQVIKLISTTVSYWVITKVSEGYMLQMYEDYNDLLEGFYYTDYSFSDNIFTHCWSFLLLNFKFETKLSFDNMGQYIALKNEPGYIPDLIKTSEGTWLLPYLNDLAIGLSGNHDVSEEDEILELVVANGIYQTSNIFVHEIKINFNHFTCHNDSTKSISNQNLLNQKVCLDVVALPFNAHHHDHKLDIYGVIVSEDDYIVRKIENPTIEKINDVLVDIIIDFSNQYGKPRYLSIANLNVLFIVYGFLSNNNIGYQRDQIFEEVDQAIIDAFGLEDEILRLLDDPNLKAVLDEFDVFDEQELEEKLNQIANEIRMLN